MSKKLPVNVAAALVMIFVGLVFLACDSSSSTSESSPSPGLTEEQKKAKDGREALDAKKAEFTTIPAKEQLAKEPYRNKQLVFYRFNKKATDEKDKWVMNDFGFGSDTSGVQNTNEAGTELRFKLAESPEEVGTIALLPECKEVSAGAYTVGSGSIPAYKEQCELILIDRGLSAVVYRKVFEGELDSIKTLYNAEKSVTANVDRMKIVKFLSYLEKKDDAIADETNKSSPF